MGSKAPDPPDLGPLAEGSAESARIAQETAREQLAWAREQDTMNRGLLDRVLASQEEVQDETLKNAQTDRARYENVYQPLEDNLVKEFQEYDSPERRQEERGRAMADVNTSFDAARRNALQRLEGYGVDPSQTRNAALDIGVRTQQAAAQAGAATAADRATEQTGRALRAEAINIGKGMPSNVAQSYGQSIQAGNSMVGNANQTTSTSGNAAQGANSFLNTSISGFGQAGNTMTQGFQNQMQAHESNQSQITGALSAVGGIAGMFMADGGATKQAIPFESEPGVIDYGAGDGSGIDDKVPIMASTEEYIIPADVVRAKGVEFFDKLVERYHTPAEEQREDQHTQNVREGKALNPAPMANGGMAGRIGGVIGRVADQYRAANPTPAGWVEPPSQPGTFNGRPIQPRPAPAAQPAPAQTGGTWNGRPITPRAPGAAPPSGWSGGVGRALPGLLQQTLQQATAGKAPRRALMY